MIGDISVFMADIGKLGLIYEGRRLGVEILYFKKGVSGI